MTVLQTHKPADDSVLVAIALAGGTESFAPIIQRYKDAVFGVALSRLHNFHDAEDLTQATFLEAFGGLERLRDPARLGAWLRTITIHRCINHVKRRARLVELDAIEEPVAVGPSPHEEAETGQLRSHVLAAIGRLSKTHRETVTLFYVAVYSMAEIAAIQDVPLGTIKRRLHDARVLLKEDMLEMVKEVLQDSVPDEAFADRVFESLVSYPDQRVGNRQVRDRQATNQIVAKFGRAGKDGFLRAYKLPHVDSRLRVVQFVAPYWGKRFTEEGPSQEFSVSMLVEALGDSNRRVRRAAADRLLYAHKLMEHQQWIRDILPHLLALLTHESKHTRRMAVGKITIWSRYAGVPADVVKQALPLTVVCRGLAQEADTEVLRRYQGLIAYLVEL